MMRVAMMAKMVAATTAGSMTAPRRPRVGDEGGGNSSTCARGRRARVARVELFDTDRAPHPRPRNRAGARE
eukprot:7815834-Pyramimonas_sp.AAC.1